MELYLAEAAFALHLLFQRPQRLIDIVVADENLHERSSSNTAIDALAVRIRTRGSRFPLYALRINA
jgi:hypothetical protein